MKSLEFPREEQFLWILGNIATQNGNRVEAVKLYQRAKVVKRSPSEHSYFVTTNNEIIDPKFSTLTQLFELLNSIVKDVEGHPIHQHTYSGRTENERRLNEQYGKQYIAQILARIARIQRIAANKEQQTGTSVHRYSPTELIAIVEEVKRLLETRTRIGLIRVGVTEEVLNETIKELKEL